MTTLYGLFGIKVRTWTYTHTHTHTLSSPVHGFHSRLRLDKIMNSLPHSHQHRPDTVTWLRTASLFVSEATMGEKSKAWVKRKAERQQQREKMERWNTRGFGKFWSKATLSWWYFLQKKYCCHEMKIKCSNNKNATMHHATRVFIQVIHLELKTCFWEAACITKACD